VLGDGVVEGGVPGWRVELESVLAESFHCGCFGAFVEVVVLLVDVRLENDG
jgi:hypothetical protein